MLATPNSNHITGGTEYRDHDIVNCRCSPTVAQKVANNEGRTHRLCVNDRYC
jgi:hypothetical protein